MQEIKVFFHTLDSVKQCEHYYKGTLDEKMIAEKTDLPLKTVLELKKKAAILMA